MTRKSDRKKCITCGADCNWVDDAWVCTRKSCGNEWPPETFAESDSICGRPTPFGPCIMPKRIADGLRETATGTHSPESAVSPGLPSSIVRGLASLLENENNAQGYVAGRLREIADQLDPPLANEEEADHG